MFDNSDLTTRVYQWLRERILHHVFLPGDKLDVQQLATELGVSRTPIKDAINRLAVEGLVTLQSRRGTYVATLSAEGMRELLDARAMIERWAIAQLTPDTLALARAEVEEVYGQMARLIVVTKAALFDGVGYSTLDQRLHAAPVALAGNALVLEMYHGIITRLNAGSLYFADEEEVLERSRVIHGEHTAILAAFRGGDLRAIDEALLQHIRHSETTYLSLLGRFAEHPLRAPHGVAPAVGA